MDDLDDIKWGLTMDTVYSHCPMCEGKLDPNTMYHQCNEYNERIDIIPCHTCYGLRSFYNFEEVDDVVAEIIYCRCPPETRNPPFGGFVLPSNVGTH